VLVVDVLPLRAHAGFKEVVVGFEGELVDWGDVVLFMYQSPVTYLSLRWQVEMALT
jgi:hypothetical protein